jgi:hypothetical protein
MGYSPGVGLVLGLGIDPSEAKAGVEQLDSTLGGLEGGASKTAEGMTESFAQTDRALIGNRESVRLLSEDLGIHLPRAVTGAIGQMLPEIAGFGGALLGVFAVEEVWKWGKAAVEAIREAEGETKELADMMHEILGEQEKILRHPKTLAEAAKDLDETTKRIGGINQEITKLQKDLVDTPKEAAQAVAGAAGAWGTPMMAEAAAMSAAAVNASKRLNELQAQLDLLTERQKAQLEEKTRLQKEADAEAARDAKRAAEEQTRIAKEGSAAWERASEEQFDFYAKRREEAARAAKQAEEHQRQQAEIAERNLAELREEEGWRIRVQGEMEKESGLISKEVAERNELTLALHGNWAAAAQLAKEIEPHGARMLDEMLRQLREHSKRLAEEWANAHPLAANIAADLRSMGIEARGLSVAQMELTAVTGQFTRAAKEEVMAVQKDIAASATQLTAGVASLIGGRRAQAGVEAVWEVARGIGCLAEGTWPPNPAAIIAAGLHFESAAEYAILAGKSSARHGGGGGGGGSYRGGGGEDYGRRGEEGGPQTGNYGLAPGVTGAGAPQGGKLTVMVVGEEAGGQWIADTLNKAQDRGVTLNATTARKTPYAAG